MDSVIFQGKYVQGIGRAHQFADVYHPAFGCPMVATFNVQADGRITDARPTRITELAWPNEAPKPVSFWLCQINGYWAWAMKWKGSRLPEDRLEFVSKRPLPASLRAEPLTIEVFERWPDATIRQWADTHYQWQGFPWLPRQRVDSRHVWETVRPHARWSGADVVDLGSHYGYHSFRASEMGACVTAVEPDDRVRAAGEVIARHIEMQDVRFRAEFDPLKEKPDIMLYLSVQHQWDPDYVELAQKIDELARYTKQVVFVEIILPPLFGREYSRRQVDEMVGGKVLDTYRHRMRGIRRIYRINGRG